MEVKFCYIYGARDRLDRYLATTKERPRYIMYGWRERSPIRYPTPQRPKRTKSLSHHHAKTSDGRGFSFATPMLEYRCRDDDEGQTEAITLRAFTDGLPSQGGDLRNFLSRKREPVKEVRPGVTEHLVQDYHYPTTVHELTLKRKRPNRGNNNNDDNDFSGARICGSGNDAFRLTDESGASSSVVVDTLVAGGGRGGVVKSGLDALLSHNTTVYMKNDVVDGDQDDKRRFKEYIKKRPLTSDDFSSCRCFGKGVQVWMRLCGCGCRCARCRAVVRYKQPEDDEDEDDPLGWS